MRNIYRETFDQIHASDRLKKEVLEMTKRETAPAKRRISKTILIAAVLTVILTGTTLAAVYCLEIRNFTPEQLAETGADHAYKVVAEVEPTPLDAFSQEALAAAADAERFWDREFDTWAEAEDFLGIQVPGVEAPTTLKLKSENGELVKAELYAYPVPLQVHTDRINIGVHATLYTQGYVEDPGDNTFLYYGLQDADNEMEREDMRYQLPDGEEAVIIFTWDDIAGSADAFLVRGNIQYWVNALWMPGGEETVLEEVKFILNNL